MPLIYRAAAEPERESLFMKSEARERIDVQKDLVASLQPGTENHRLAMKVLTLLQDSANLIAETRVMIVTARMASK